MLSLDLVPSFLIMLPLSPSIIIFCVSRVTTISALMRTIWGRSLKDCTSTAVWYGISLSYSIYIFSRISSETKKRVGRSEISSSGKKGGFSGKNSSTAGRILSVLIFFVTEIASVLLGFIFSVNAAISRSCSALSLIRSILLISRMVGDFNFRMEMISAKPSMLSVASAIRRATSESSIALFTCCIILLCSLYLGLMIPGVSEKMI
ncbi:hypothetical protein D3C86_1313920 [compost metagenome]